MAVLTLFSGLALLAVPSLQHLAIMPPMPDKPLIANSTEAPAGCKLLACDKGWPADSVWKSTFPGVFKKLRGTVGPDWMMQARNVEDVQKAVNFAREHNVRLSVITTGHDFHGRGTARSGLRLDLATLREPTVFSNEWKCGDTLKPQTTAGKYVDAVQACKVQKTKRSLRSRRGHDYKFFEKRDGFDCDRLLKLHKRQMGGDSHGHAPVAVPESNTIKIIPGKQAYARVSGGLYNELFFEQADKSGLMTAGAQHNGVSVVGGWMQGGGHNPFVNRIGMAVDNMVEIEVVTADGKFQKVSECNNPELFWALRGGGGNTYGVVTGGTVKVHPTFPVIVTRFFVNSTNRIGVMEATAHFLQQGAKLRDQYGLQGYFYVMPGSFQSVLHLPGEYATMDIAKKAIEPLMAKMEEIAGGKHIPPQYIAHKSYKAWYLDEMGDEEMEEAGTMFRSWNDGADGTVPSMMDAMTNPMLLIPWAVRDPQFPEKRKRSLDTSMSVESTISSSAETTIMRSQANARHYLDSRLLSDKHVNSVSLKALGLAINQTMVPIDGIQIRGFLYGGGKQAQPSKDALGLLPAWRDATYHFIINAVPGMIRRDYDIGPIAKLFPDAGAYVNEASPGEPNWKKVFWGDHYEKLEQIKKKYDPTNVFWCSPCVGSDMFTYDDERICKNPAYPEAGPPPQTYPNDKSKRGIASLPGGPGIPNPLQPVVETWALKGTLPQKMLKSNFFKIAMGEGGSAGGKFKDMDPYRPGEKLKETV